MIIVVRLDKKENESLLMARVVTLYKVPWQVMSLLLHTRELF